MNKKIDDKFYEVSLKYVAEPKTRTRSSFIRQRKSSLLKENDKTYLELEQRGYKDERARLDQRDADIKQSLAI